MREETVLTTFYKEFSSNIKELGWAKRLKYLITSYPSSFEQKNIEKLREILAKEGVTDRAIIIEYRNYYKEKASSKSLQLFGLALAVVVFLFNYFKPNDTETIMMEADSIIYLFLMSLYTVGYTIFLIESIMRDKYVYLSRCIQQLVNS